MTSADHHNIQQQIDALAASMSAAVVEKVDNSLWTIIQDLQRRVVELESKSQNGCHRCEPPHVDERLATLERRQNAVQNGLRQLERETTPTYTKLLQHVKQQDATLALLVEEGEHMSEMIEKKMINIGHDIVMEQLEPLREWLSHIEGLFGSWYAGPTVQTQLDQLNDRIRRNESKFSVQLKQNDENEALRDQLVDNLRVQVEGIERQTRGLHKLVSQQLRNEKDAQSLLQEHVSTITQQVVRVTRQYVSMRIQDNNRLLDATLRARIPDYVENDTASFMLVRHGDDKGILTQQQSD